jgi:mRNA-degrading endonuclease RelE of RelBE toxin-antitoxin system
VKRKPRPAATTPEAVPNGTVRLGFSRGASAVCSKLPAKVQTGLRRKLHDFGENPAIGKPLVGPLQGYHRVSYGRIRTVSMRAVVSVSDGIILVHVLHVGLRKEGAADDAYELATSALQRGDAEAIQVLEQLLQQFHAGQLPEMDEDQ